MTNLQYSISVTLVLGLQLLCVPTNTLPTSSSNSGERTENDATSPKIPAVQGSSSQEGKNKSETGYNNPYEEVPSISKPPSFNNFDQYENPVSRGHLSLSGNQNQLLYPSLYPVYPPYPSVPYRTKSSLIMPSTNVLAQRNMRLLQLIQRMRSQNGFRRGRYMYPIQNMYPTQFQYSYTPVPNVIPPPVNVQPTYPQYTNMYPSSVAMLLDSDLNSFIPQNSLQNEQSQTSSSQNGQQQRPQQNTNNAPSQNQEDHNSNSNQNSEENQPGNQNVPQQPNVNQNGNQNHPGNGSRNANQNQNGYPSSDIQTGGGQNAYPGGMYPNQNINQFPNVIPIQYGGSDYNVPVIFQNPFPYGYRLPNQNVQYRSVST